MTLAVSTATQNNPTYSLKQFEELDPSQLPVKGTLLKIRCAHVQSSLSDIYAIFSQRTNGPVSSWQDLATALRDNCSKPKRSLTQWSIEGIALTDSLQPFHDGYTETSDPITLVKWLQRHPFEKKDDIRITVLVDNYVERLEAVGSVLFERIAENAKKQGSPPACARIVQQYLYAT